MAQVIGDNSDIACGSQDNHYYDWIVLDQSGS